jgi:hypothetical protein
MNKNLQPDPSWKELYKAGGISALLYVVIAIIIPGVMYMIHPIMSEMESGKEVLKLISSEKTSWLILQTTVLGTSFLAIITFVALYKALKNTNKSYALIGTLIAITCHILFIAYYPVLLGLTYLAENYQAAGGIQQSSIHAAADALLAINNAFNPLYESVFAISVLILSLVMLKSVFHKIVAYLGILTAIASFTALILWPVLEIGYLWWWALFMIWFVAVGWKLILFAKK